MHGGRHSNLWSKNLHFTTTKGCNAWHGKYGAYCCKISLPSVSRHETCSGHAKQPLLTLTINLIKGEFMAVKNFEKLPRNHRNSKKQEENSRMLLESYGYFSKEELMKDIESITKKNKGL